MIGSWSLISNLRVLKEMCESGLDYIILDLEHGQHSCEGVQDFVSHAKSFKVHITLRTAELTEPCLQKLIDSDAEAIQLAGIKDLQVLDDLERRLGSLGFSPWVSRKDSADLPKLAFQVEFGDVWQQFLNLDSVPTAFSASFLGRYDMSKSLGHELKSPDDFEVCRLFVETCRRLEIEAWLIAIDAEDYRHLGDLGATRISLGSDVSRLRQSPHPLD